MKRRVTLLLPLLLGAALLPSCGGSGAPSRAVEPCEATPSIRDEPTQGGVGRATATFVDRSRSTSDGNGGPRACRALVTVIRIPAGSTPAPMIVAAHGLDGDPSALRDLLDVWARAGYVVVAPTFPITPKDEEGSSLRSESVAQARDLRFVIDRMLSGNRPGASPWSGRIDADHIGAAGMSLGGLAVYGVTTATCCTDPRVRAAVLLAAVYRELPHSEHHPNEVPMLLEHGDADRGYHNSVRAYDELVAPKWFVTLHGARHAPPFEVPRGPEKPIVDATTVDFWNLTLRGDRASAADLRSAVAAVPKRASLQADVRP